MLLLLRAPPSSGGGGGQTKVWDGADWVVGVMKVWDGASWVPGVLKVWDGSQWQPGAGPDIVEDFTDLTDVNTATGGFTASGRLRTAATGTFSVATNVDEPVFADQYSEIDVATFGSGAEAGCAVRVDSSAGTAYVVHCINGSSIDFLEIRAGWSVWDLHTFTASVPTAPFTLRAEIVGTTIEAFVDGVSVGTLDVTTVIGAPLLTAGTPGVAMWNTDDVANTEVESWEASAL